MSRMESRFCPTLTLKKNAQWRFCTSHEYLMKFDVNAQVNLIELFPRKYSPIYVSSFFVSLYQGGIVIFSLPCIIVTIILSIFFSPSLLSSHLHTLHTRTLLPALLYSPCRYAIHTKKERDRKQSRSYV